VYQIGGNYYLLDHTAQTVSLDTSNGQGLTYQATGGDYNAFCQQVLSLEVAQYNAATIAANPIGSITDSNGNTDSILTAQLNVNPMLSTAGLNTSLLELAQPQTQTLNPNPTITG
jgi:hypothetical protein